MKKIFFFKIVWATITIGVLVSSPATATGSPSPFPNAIQINREDMDGLLAGIDVISPYGIVSILSLKTGMTFMNSGDIGAETWFANRGFGRDNSRLILVLLDGRPLNLATNGTVEFDDIPMNIVESITVYPGPVPAQYGGYQTVIDVKTIHNTDLVQAKTSISSLNTYRFSTTLSNSGRFYYLANFDLDLSKGASDTQLNGILSDFRYANRQVYTMLPTLKAGYEITKDLDLSVNGSFIDFNKLYNYETYTEDETFRRRKMQNYSLLLQPGKGSELDYMFSFFHTREKEFQHCIFPENTTYNMHWGNQKRYLTGFRGHYRHQWAGLVALKAGGEAQWVKGNTDEDYLYFKYKDKQNYYSAFAQSEFTLWKGGYINIGVRMDGQKDISKTYFSPVFAANQSLLNDQLSFYASYGVTSRWIPLNEVNTFYRPISTIVSFGPPVSSAEALELSDNTLAIERTKAFDAGVKGKLFNQKLNLGANYFYMKNEGQLGTTIFEIAKVKDTEYLAMAKVDRNFPGYDISQGLEFEADYKPFRSLYLFANATYFITCKTEKYKETEVFESVPAAGQFVLAYDGNSIIPGAYKWLANWGATYRPVSDGMLNLVFRYRSKMYDPIMKMGVDPETDHLSRFVTVDLAASYNIIKKRDYTVKATVSAYNLFDKS
ncbi:MAG: TonB-dependent receptor plug domain-containing protein [Tannerellaceae bacterium]|nr:TonB-dependent receptor plug domain-containing protein [Tannerellaceae bacterium]